VKVLAVLCVIALVLMSLSGCTSVAAPSVCPPLVEYSPEFTERFREQLKTIPEGSPIAVYIIDQTELRDQLRECQS
jgi:hypothetical protein